MNTRETSIEAYIALVEENKLPKANRAVYEYLYKNGPTTQKKTERALGDRTYTMRPRFAQLERMGLIKVCGEIKCEETNRQNILWDVTSLMEPLPIPRKLSNEAKKKELLRLLGTLTYDIYNNDKIINIRNYIENNF